MLDLSDIPDGHEGHLNLVTATALMRFCQAVPEFAMQLRGDNVALADFRFIAKCLHVLAGEVETRGRARFGDGMTTDPAEDEELTARAAAALIDPRPGRNGQRARLADCDWGDSRMLRARQGST